MIYGQYEQFVIDINKLVVLPQVRKRKNPKIDEIADSIEDRGLINPLDVVKLNYEMLNSHINFINELWKKNININSFVSIDDYYYVVVAGHTRLEALKKIANNKNVPVEVFVKIHNVKTSEEILAIQLDENIHSVPTIEERAVAIIETFRLGIINGKWHNKKEFVKQNKDKFSRHILNDALDFSNLPLEIQKYVFANSIPFSVGVELGKILPLIKEYESFFDDSRPDLEKGIKFHYARLLIKLHDARSVKQALTIISSHCKNLNERLNVNDDMQQQLFLTDGVDEQRKAYHEYLINEYKKNLRILNSLPFEKFTELFKTNEKLTNISHEEDIHYISALYGEYYKKCFLAPVSSVKVESNKRKVKT